jgi:hypothetical protein
MQPVAFVVTAWGAAPPIVVTEPVEPRASSATRETEDCSAPQHLHRDSPDLEHVLLNSWVEYEWCITDAAERLERQIDTRCGELTKAVDQLVVADQEGHVVISHAEFTRPPNVPPLSSGRIRKRGGVRWRRASPWYITTGERKDGAGSDKVRPSASTACWAALVSVGVRLALARLVIRFGLGRTERRARAQASDAS